MLDRLVHNRHRITLKCGPMRKHKRKTVAASECRSSHSPQSPPGRPRPADAGIDGRQQPGSRADIGGMRGELSLRVPSIRSCRYLCQSLRTGCAAPPGRSEEQSVRLNRDRGLGERIPKGYFRSFAPTVLHPFQRRRPEIRQKVAARSRAFFALTCFLTVPVTAGEGSWKRITRLAKPQ
jgi:hypothetical protein